VEQPVHTLGVWPISQVRPKNRVGAPVRAPTGHSSMVFPANRLSNG
jgi:hypothetical protein